MRAEISRWTHGEDWRTWVAHATLAIVYTVAFGVPTALVFSQWTDWPPALGFAIGGAVSVVFYFLREVDQVFYLYVDRKPRHWPDHLMDVAAPVMAVVPLVALVWALA